MGIKDKVLLLIAALSLSGCSMASIAKTMEGPNETLARACVEDRLKESQNLTDEEKGFILIGCIMRNTPADITKEDLDAFTDVVIFSLATDETTRALLN